MTHYLCVFIFVCYNVETKNVFDALACDDVAFGIQVSPTEYITARNLFDNELLVVTISQTALSMSTVYSYFMERTCNDECKLIHINMEDRPFYRNMLLFIFIGQLLECVRSNGINPNSEGDPYYFGFHQDGVDRYGYYLLFLINLPAYVEKIWDLENADYLHLMPIKEKM
jgi:hypothetical protein